MSPRLRIALLVGIFRFLLVASDAPLFTGYSPGTLRNDYTAYVGVQFTVGSSPLTVTQLGRLYIAGNQRSHIVKLMRSSDNTEVPNGSVTITFPAGTIGQFTYVALSTPVILSAGTTYNLVSFETAGGDQWGDYGGITPSPGVTVKGPEYQNWDDTWKLVPFANYSYVPVNLITSTSSTVVPTAVSMTSPLAGATLCGASVPLTATATATSGATISSLVFKLDGAPLPGTVTHSGNVYSGTADTTKLANGAHIIDAVATDSAGTVVTSTDVPVTVNNTTTSVTITSPAGNASVSGTIALSATASAATGLTISSVVFNVDGLPLPGTVTGSSGSYSLMFDTTTLINGTHTLTAAVTDSSHNTVTSTVVSFTVNNKLLAVSITSPAAGASVSGTINLLATATTSAGLTITSVVFKLDGTLLSGAVSSSGNVFLFVLDSTKTTNASHVLTAVATDSGANTVTSSPVSFVVSNSTTVTPPPTTATLPAGMSFDGSMFIAGAEHRFEPAVTGLAPHSINSGIHWFNSVADPVLAIGYNQSYSGSTLQSGEPGLSWNIEGNYNDGSASTKMEAYLQYISENGSVVIRPFMFQIDRTSKKLIGSLLQGDPVNVNSAATGEPLAQFWRTGAIVFKPLTVNGAMAAQVIQSIPQPTDPGCDANSIGKIWFDNTTNTTVERHCLSLSGVPTWVIK